MGNQQTQRVRNIALANECGGQCSQIHDYWNSLRHGGLLPSFKDFDPSRVPPRVLPGLVMLEPLRDPETSQRRLWLRLVGTSLVNTYGRDPTGNFLDEVYIADDYDDVTTQFDVLFESGRATCMWSATRTRDERYMNYERIVLPFAENGRDIDMTLASVEFFPADHQFNGNLWTQPPLETRLTLR